MSEQNLQDIVASKDQGVLALGFNRPAKKNALTRDMYAALAREISAANSDDEVGAILIYGEGVDFTSGNDVNDFLEHPPSGSDSAGLALPHSDSRFHQASSRCSDRARCWSWHHHALSL